MSPQGRSYENLVDSCLCGNSLKQDVTGLMNPNEAGYGAHLRIDADGRVVSDTSKGSDVVDILMLDESEIRQM